MLSPNTRQKHSHLSWSRHLCLGRRGVRALDHPWGPTQLTYLCSEAPLLAAVRPPSGPASSSWPGVLPGPGWLNPLGTSLHEAEIEQVPPACFFVAFASPRTDLGLCRAAQGFGDPSSKVPGCGVSLSRAGLPRLQAAPATPWWCSRSGDGAADSGDNIREGPWRPPPLEDGQLRRQAKTVPPPARPLHRGATLHCQALPPPHQSGSWGASSLTAQPAPERARRERSERKWPEPRAEKSLLPRAWCPVSHRRERLPVLSCCQRTAQAERSGRHAASLSTRPAAAQSRAL